MSFENAVELEEVSKSYRIFARPIDRLKHMFGGGTFQDVAALRGVSFNVPAGGCLGILGRNGAGKSTLLQLITGILQPTSGRISINGRVSALLELGAGFNPEFTGRENVMLSGAIHGWTEEALRSKFGEIERFADIGPFIEQPVKTYSSGMMIRLAFAVAIHVDPDILIIDEALAVGDAKFQAKCFRKFEEFRERQKTIILVTHSPELVVRHCDSEVVLENGGLYFQGTPNDAVNEYLQLLFGTDVAQAQPAAPPENQVEDFQSCGWHDFASSSAAHDRLCERPGYNRGEFRWGNGDVVISDCFVSTDRASYANHCFSSDELTIAFRASFRRDVACPIYGLTIKTPDGVTVYGINSRDVQPNTIFAPQRCGDTVIARFRLCPKLIAGNYLLSFGVAEQRGEDVVPLDRRYDVLHLYLTSGARSFGIADLEAQFDFAQESPAAQVGNI